jgi:CRISPR-associated endonuclease/helicase Cas3
MPSSINPSYLWAKKDRENNSLWHPLILHLLDVAACAEVILAREPLKTRTMMAAVLGLEWDDARPWLLFLIACHDLGKACPGFQAKWPDHIPEIGLSMPPRPNTSVRHGFVGQLALKEILLARNWPESLADLVADAVGCHHGARASEQEKDEAFRETMIGRGKQEILIRQQWAQARHDLLHAILEVFEPGTFPIKSTVTGPEFMFLAGMTSFADWIYQRWRESQPF